MKFTKINVNSKIIFLILVFSFSLGVIDMLGIIKWNVTARDEHQPHDDWHTTSKDTYISERVNGSNYGEGGYLKIGDAISGQNISYLYFSFSSYDTSSGKSVDLIIYVTGISQEMLLDIHVADSNDWDEDTINWTNAPTYGNSIAQKSVSTTEFVRIDVSSALINSPIPEITFVIVSETLSSMSFRSKENQDTRMEDEYPHLIFIRDIVPGFDIFITILFLSIVSTLVGIKLKLNRKLKVEGC
ncbi:MAG: CBM96 family carbohydrate-binding protein [Promethearchaeota archaeon]